VKIFPIKKRINTALLIDPKHRLYIQKWFKKLSGLIEKGKCLCRENKSGKREHKMAACLE